MIYRREEVFIRCRQFSKKAGAWLVNSDFPVHVERKTEV